MRVAVAPQAAYQPRRETGVAGHARVVLILSLSLKWSGQKMLEQRDNNDCRE